MADLNFPPNPTVGDTYTLGSRTWIWNGNAWQLQSAIQSLDPFTVKTLVVTSSTNSTSTNSGAVIVEGGVGIGGDLYVGGTFYAGGQAVLTTSSFIAAISEGSDIRITEGTSSTIIISNTSTLQSVTGRGSTTTNKINISNTTNAISSTTGALTVAGGIGIQQDLWVGGKLYITEFGNKQTVYDIDAIPVGTVPVILDSFYVTDYRSAKYFISISNTSTNQFQTSEIWMVQDGTSAAIEQTSVFSSGNNYVVTFSTEISGGVVSLVATGIGPDNSVKVQSTYITV